MVFMAHQLGHVVQGFVPAPEFYTPGTHVRKTYSHRRVRRPRALLAVGVLAWICF